MNSKYSTVRTSRLEIAYEEHGSPNAFPVLLLHGWPDDVRTWDRVAERLIKAGYRTIAPYVRGFGPTRYLEPGTPRSGQPAAIAQDAIDLMDRLKIEKFLLVGHDWGARAAYVIAAVWPSRVERLVALSIGYGINESQQSFKQAHNYWYHWYFHLQRGEEALLQNRRSLCHYLWKSWSPSFDFDEASFELTAQSWDNPDWVDTTLHYYRHLWQAVPGDPHYDGLEKKTGGKPPIQVPTKVLHGGEDSCTNPGTSANLERYFAGSYSRQELSGIGHFPARERPDAVADVILNL